MVDSRRSLPSARKAYSREKERASMGSRTMKISVRILIVSPALTSARRSHAENARSSTKYFVANRPEHPGPQPAAAKVLARAAPHGVIGQDQHNVGRRGVLGAPRVGLDSLLQPQLRAELVLRPPIRRVSLRHGGVERAAEMEWENGASARLKRDRRAAVHLA